MNTKVYRIDLVAEVDVAKAIETASDKLFDQGFWLASSFIVGTALVLIYQKMPPSEIKQQQ